MYLYLFMLFGKRTYYSIYLIFITKNMCFLINIIIDISYPIYLNYVSTIYDYRKLLYILNLHQYYKNKVKK